MQFNLLRELGFDMPSWTDLSYVLITVLSLTAAAGAVWALWDRQRQDPWLRLQRRVQQRLSQLGVQVGPNDPPRARALQVRLSLGARGEPLAETLEALDRARYAPGGQRHINRQWWQGFSKAAATITART